MGLESVRSTTSTPLARSFARASATGTHTTTGGSTGGTGIGLAIVRWAIDLHGGRIEVADSRSGATMRVTLPARAHAVEPDLLGEPAPGPEGPTTR